MTIDLEQARSLAIEHLCEEYRQSITLRPSPIPEPGVYNFDPRGWATFVVEINEPPYRTGGSLYVAVKVETGETRTLDVMSE